MRLSPSLLLLPVLVAAQEQVPLKEQLQGWFDKAKSFMPTTPSASAPAGTETAHQAQAPPPIAKDKPVTPVTLDNWRSILSPVEPGSPGAAKEWLIFVTGGNKSCFGHCVRAEKAFNESLPLFAADPTSPSLGLLDCEKENLLCSIWSTGPPALWHIDLPVKAASSDQLKPQTPIHINRLNVTTVTSEDVYKVHSQKLWKEKPKYEGAFHPMDGWLAEYGLNVVVGYVLYGFSMVPSWAMMIGISFISRSMMSRQTGNAGQRAAPA